jgi:hypothetical protein
VREGLTGLLLAPAPAVDAVAWRAAVDDATATLARLAVRRAGAAPFRVTDHEVRRALGGAEADDTPFAWTARTARRGLGVAALRALITGEARTPMDAVRTRVAEVGSLVRSGDPSASGADRWLAGLPPAGRAAVGAEAVTWATRLWCALDWPALGPTAVIGRDRWWDSPHSALLALRSRAEVRTPTANLVVLSGPRRASVRSELALVALVDSLRSGGRQPGRVVGWWPDSGRVVRVEPEPTAISLGADAVALVLGGAGSAVRPRPVHPGVARRTGETPGKRVGTAATASAA